MKNVRTEVLLGRLFETIDEGELTQQVAKLTRFVVDNANDKIKIFLLEEVLAFDYYTALVHYLGHDVKQAIQLARLAAKEADVEPPEIAREPKFDPDADDDDFERRRLKV
jgi:hypothetical protein